MNLRSGEVTDILPSFDESCHGHFSNELRFYEYFIHCILDKTALTVKKALNSNFCKLYIPINNVSSIFDELKDFLNDSERLTIKSYLQGSVPLRVCVVKVTIFKGLLEIICLIEVGVKVEQSNLLRHD